VQLIQKLESLALEEESLATVTGDAEKFLNSWRRIRDLFGKASTAVRREIVQAFVEELVWIPAVPKGKIGTYRLKFFPEVLDDRQRHLMVAIRAEEAPPVNHRMNKKTHRC
jgi:hypothetical protein